MGKPWQIQALEYEGDNVYRKQAKRLLMIKENLKLMDPPKLVTFNLASAAGMLWQIADEKEADNG